MASTVTTCITAVQWGATTALPQSSGVAFQWSGKVRTLWFANYRFPRRPQYCRVNRGNLYQLTQRSVRIRKVVETNIPGLVVYATWSQDGSMRAFHIEKASGLPFNEGQVVLTNVRD